MKPIKVRNGIPFYYDKSDSEFRMDVYEQYDTTVLKNARRYLSGNRVSESLNYLVNCIRQNDESTVIVENGCGIGYHTAMISKEFGDALIFGFDLSYQMLSMAADLWIHKKKSTNSTLTAFFQKHGLSLDVEMLNQNPKMQLALAKCEKLPLENEMVDVSYSCYLWDRIVDNKDFVLEQHRILRIGGYLIVLGPMSFTNNTAWEAWYPFAKLVAFVEDLGFKLIDQSSWQERDVFDGRNNHIAWQVEGFCFEKV